jgi:hypothetical protein
MPGEPAGFAAGVASLESLSASVAVIGPADAGIRFGGFRSYSISFDK